MVVALQGLSTRQAQALRDRFGPNAVPPEKREPLRTVAARLWAPVPWLLEATLLLTVFTARYADSVAIVVLLLFNAAIATIQEGRARSAIDLLRTKITVRTHVLRDGKWCTLPADQLVPGDLIQVGVGAIVPADIDVRRGAISVDQSILTGESVARTVSVSETAYAGSTVVRGDAQATVTSTGATTKFGKTVELLHVTKAPGQLERFVLHLVTVLTAISIAVITAIAAIAAHYSYGITDIAVFSIMILLASVPIALPAAFTLATTLGSLEIARRGALVTRLSALEDAASMDVLCTDKTGTITEDRMTVVACTPFDLFSESDVVMLAAAAADDAGQDPIDLAVLQFAATMKTAHVQRSAFTPFDPSTKRSSAEIIWNGSSAVAMKGSPDALRGIGNQLPIRFDHAVSELAAQKGRVVAIALCSGGATVIAGLIAIADPPRIDARPFITRLREMGLSVHLLTGDTETTALSVARQVGIPDSAVHASVYPNEKVDIITRLQREQHVVGMTGDGINDAPALRAAGVGIAVSTATDVAKAAAGIILTEPGLANIVAAVETSRAIFERMVTYTMLKLVKYLEIVGTLSIGFLATRNFLLTPELMVALLVFNDGVTLSISTDNVTPSRTFSTWHVGRLLRASFVPALATTVAVILAIVMAAKLWHLDFAQLRSVTFLAMVTMGQISVYFVRTRSNTIVPPSRWLAIATALSVVGACVMVLLGILTKPLPPALVACVIGMLTAFGVLLLFAFSLSRRSIRG